MTPPPTRIESVRSGGVARIRLVLPEGKPPTLDHAVLDELTRALG